MFIRTLRLYEKEHRYGYKDKDTGKIVVAPLYENGKEYPIVIGNRNYFAVQFYFGLFFHLGYSPNISRCLHKHQRTYL